MAFDGDEIDDLTENRFGDKRSFSLLSIIFPHLNLRQHFRIDHVFSKSRFTRAKLNALGISEEKEEHLQNISDRLPNLQLLQGHENQQKRAILPAECLQTFSTDEARRNYATMHLLGDVPEGIHGFESFYETHDRAALLEQVVARIGE